MDEEKISNMERQPVSEMPKLVLDESELAPAAEAKPEITPVKLDESALTVEERQQVLEFSQRIDLNNSAAVLQYGAVAQKKIAGFSESALEKVRTRDLGEVGEAITGLVGELQGFDIDEEEKGGVFGFFKKQANKISALKAKYDRVEANVDKISGVLEGHQVTLLKDIAMLDQMYELNLNYFKELSMYILAGKRRLEKAMNEELPALREKAAASGLPEDAQAANDFAQKCNNFEKKLHDLELTRMVSIQMGPQIRMLQTNDSMMSEKIQSTLVNTIPLWKSQMVLALGVAHSQQAMQAQRAATDLTNQLLRKNAETLKMGSVEAAKEAERGIVDIETLKYTNQQLISTLDEVMKIQEEGRQKRRAAEEELGRIEGELKQKLLEVRK